MLLINLTSCSKSSYSECKQTIRCYFWIKSFTVYKCKIFPCIFICYLFYDRLHNDFVIEKTTDSVKRSFKRIVFTDIKMHVSCWLCLLTVLVGEKACADILAQMSTCKISSELRDRWVLSDSSRNKLRIRRRSVVFKEPGRVLRYKCLESKGNNTYLLRSRNIEYRKDGVVCLGFSPLNRPSAAEFKVVRLITASTFGHELMGPKLVNSGSNLTIDNTCTGVNQHIRFFIHRTVPGCRFAKGLRRTWLTSLRFGWNMTFTKSDFIMTLSNGSSINFRCEKRDKNFYLVRSMSLLPGGQDGVLCVDISPLPDDPFYNYQISRLNEGDGQTLETFLKFVPRGKVIYPYMDCEWVESPARPVFIYPP
ncbi:uncharacterized protein LOC117336309 [Pecten maximus]|uniref:uncharacterized protein LOC117336309 n=1 Tax=Pecten maximus TaxID=6579 RepID=UPI001458FE3B|nr:uncharacterized protein LOC117336309 [Pecten maximus]